MPIHRPPRRRRLRACREDARQDKSLPQAELANFVQEAHEKICPYSHATRGNVDVAFDVIGG